MKNLRRSILACACTCAALAFTASPSLAIVGGKAASANEYPSVAKITFGGFLCTGTLIAPNWVLSAGHCGSATGATGVGSPISWPAALITVRIGGHNSSTGETRPVRRVVIHPKYMLNIGYDITLIELSSPSSKTPTQVAGASDRALWDPGDLETIVGWGATREGGSASSTLQEAQVPVTTDAYCADAYSDFESTTMVCAGYPQGGVDTCQGDSGGPMFGGSPGAWKVVGATSWGEGCARAGKPGVYARVADTTLREWIRGYVPAGVGS